MKKTELGAWGEAKAAEYLSEKGYCVLARNYRCRMGEIDLVVRRGDTVAFVEVKLRKDSSHGAPREFVTASKQQKLRMTASRYLMEHPAIAELQLRFDVIEIYAPDGSEGSIAVSHLENAFF